MLFVNYTRSCVEIYSPQNTTKNRLPTSENKKETLLHLPYNRKKYAFIFNIFLICGMNYTYSSKVITCCQCCSVENGNHVVSYDTLQCTVRHVHNNTVIPSESEQCSKTNQGIQTVAMTR